jgi:hypothetical protein
VTNGLAASCEEFDALLVEQEQFRLLIPHACVKRARELIDMLIITFKLTLIQMEAL